MRTLLLLSLILLAPAARASILEPTASVSDAKALVAAIDTWLELSENPGAAGVDRDKMAQGLAESLGRLEPMRFNGAVSLLLADYGANRGHRTDLERFLALVSKAAGEHRAKQVRRFGISMAEDALIFAGVLAALHIGPKAVMRADLGVVTAASKLAQKAPWLGKYGKPFGWLWSFLTIFHRTTYRYLSYRPGSPSAKLLHLSNPDAPGLLQANWRMLYPAFAAAGVGKATWHLMDAKKNDPMDSLAALQLTLVSELAERAELLRLPDAERAEAARNSAETGFEPELPLPRAEERAEIEEELQALAQSSRQEVAEAARAVSDKLNLSLKDETPSLP